VNESMALLIEPADSAALAAAIAELVDRPELRAALGAAALAHAGAFRLECRASRVLTLLRDVAGG